MKVLHVVTDTDRRGAQVFACDLSAAMNRGGHDSQVVALAPGQVGGLDVPTLSTSRRQISSFKQVRELMRDADVTVAHGSSTVLVCSVSSLGRRRRFVTRQISETRFWSGSLPRRLRVGVYLWRARAVVALAESAADDLHDVLWVARSKIRVIPNGVPSSTITRDTDHESAKAEFGIDADTKVVGYVGALAEEKGVDLAISAIAGRSDVALLVLGDGPERERLEALSEEVAPGRVIFAGSVSSPAAGLAAMDIFVLPSRGGDSMPAVLIEAGFCGLPSVTTSVGAIRDVVLDGITGFVVEPNKQDLFASAVHTLLDDPSLRTELGAAARHHCLERFDIDVVASAWEKVLESVIAND